MSDKHVNSSLNRRKNLIKSWMMQSLEVILIYQKALAPHWPKQSSLRVTRRICWPERPSLPWLRYTNIPTPSFQWNKVKQARVVFFFFYNLQREKRILWWSTKTSSTTHFKHLLFINRKKCSVLGHNFISPFIYQKSIDHLLSTEDTNVWENIHTLKELPSINRKTECKNPCN